MLKKLEEDKIKREINNKNIIVHQINSENNEKTQKNMKEKKINKRAQSQMELFEENQKRRDKMSI